MVAIMNTNGSASIRVPCIEVQNVSKRFWIDNQRATTISGFFVYWLQPGKRTARKSFMALRDISFTVYPGETVALIGANGSGKSTLLKIVSGIYAATKGTINVRQSLVALLELGTGFSEELTGRENIYLNGALLGHNHAEMRAIFEAIVSFSGIGDFLDTKLKYYSSGMRARLGFSIAAHVDASILLLDEVLSVGDAEFQQKCIRRLREFQAEGRTLIVVSHGTDLLQELCDRAIWLARGKVVQDGPVAEVVAAYSEYVKALNT
jgi:ABC-type polysaccharide/polyol phosphate transport system ATPase subunit